MTGTFTYLFDPEETVYAIVECCAQSNNQSSSSGLQISNSQFPSGHAIQPFPASGEIIVREGVVKEIRTSVRQDPAARTSTIAVGVLGGVVVTTGTLAEIRVNVTAGAVTTATLVNAGTRYLDGTGFTIDLTTTAGGGDGLAQLTYDVVDGSLTNLVVTNSGSTYTDGASQLVNETPAPVGVDLVSGGFGYSPDSAKAQFTCDIVGGVVVDVDLLLNGAQYNDGTYIFNLLTSFGGGDGLAEITATIANDVVTSVFVSNGGGGYIDGINNVVDASDVPEPIKSFLLVNSAGGGNGLAEIGYTVANNRMVQPRVINGGAGYTDGARVVLNSADVDQVNLKEHELVYRIRFNDDNQTLLIRAPVDENGVQLDPTVSGQGDIFDNITDALTEYEIRITS